MTREITQKNFVLKDILNKKLCQIFGKFIEVGIRN